MLEAQDLTPAGLRGGTRTAMVPGPARPAVTPVAHALTESVRDRASNAFRAGHRSVLPSAATQQRERRPTL
jgi:hypothetical protein